MAYDSNEPAGSRALETSDDVIRNNFAQIVANISNEHVWHNSTAANVVHYRECGLITKNISVDAVVDENLTIITGTPKLVVFHYHYLGAATNDLTCIGTGYYDGTNQKFVASCWPGVAGTASAQSGTSNCMIVFDGSVAIYSAATCAFNTGKFTLTWVKANSPTSANAHIIYEAFG